MNLDTKGKVNILADVYDNTIVDSIWNGIITKTSVDVVRIRFVEVSHTERNINLVGFNNDLSKKSILVGTSTTTTEIPNGTDIAFLNKNLLLR